MRPCPHFRKMTEPTENTASVQSNAEWSAAPDAAALEGQIAELRAQLAAAQDAQLRIAAEAENSRRRIEREAQASARYATERLLGDLIGVADALELGLQAAAVFGRSRRLRSRHCPRAWT
jgi:molecular chaperone GrpE